MIDGKFWQCLLLIAILVMPAAMAAPPSRADGFATAFPLAGQDISGFAVDDTGRFGIATPVYDRLKATLPTQPTKRDVYICDFAGAGCKGLNHVSADGSSGSPQLVDAASYQVTGGITARFAVGGPGGTVSFWSNVRDTPIWTKQLASHTDIKAIALERSSASRLVVASDPSISGASRISVYDTTGNGELAWTWNAVDSGGSSARVKDMAYARDVNLLAVGTTRGLVFLQPANDAAPTATSQVKPVDMTGIEEVLMTSSGNATLARTSSGVYYIPLVNGVPAGPGEVWYRGLPGTVTSIALSQDGQRFAAAAGGKVFFYDRLNTSHIATEMGQAYDVGAAIASLDYDQRGDLLVAVAGTRVLGFGQARQTPIWTFDASQSQHGGMDGPLRFAQVSDDARRISVAGKTTVMPYRTATQATVQIEGPGTREVAPASVMTLQARITNTGSLADEYSFRLVPPSGWLGNSPGAIALSPDEEKTVDFTIEVPSGERPRTAGVTFEVMSKQREQMGESRVIATATANFTVPRSVMLEIDVSDAILTVSRGREESFPVTIRNRGNADGVVNLSALQATTGGASWPLRFENAQLHVTAGSEASTQMILSAPPEAASGARSTITIKASEGVRETTRVVAAYLDPEWGSQITSGLTGLEILPGETRTFTVNISNVGNTPDTFNITANVTPDLLRSHWVVTISPEQIEIPRAGNRLLTVSVRSAVAEPSQASLVITGVSMGSGEAVSNTLTLALIPKDPEEEAPSRIPLPALPLILFGVIGSAFVRSRMRGAR